MFRPLTLLSLVAAAGAGYYLYQVKQSVAQLDRELRDVRRQTETAMERTQVLRAEWAMLNEPDRLRQVVQRTLTLEPMTPGQFVRFSDLSRRTGAPQVFAGAPSLFAAPRAAVPDDAVAVATAAPAPAAPPPAAQMAVASLVPSAQVAVPVRPTASVPVEPPRAAAAAPPHQPAPVAAPAPAEPPRVAVAAAARPVAPRPAPARPAPAAEPRPAAPPPVQQAAAAALVRPAVHVQPVGLGSASVLGIGRSALPPPVPFGSAQAATPGR